MQIFSKLKSNWSTRLLITNLPGSNLSSIVIKYDLLLWFISPLLSPEDIVPYLIKLHV